MTAALQLPSARAAYVRPFGNPINRPFSRPRSAWPALRLAALAAATAGLALAASAAERSAELSVRVDDRQPAAQGPLAQADALAPGLASPPASGVQLQAELQQTLRGPWGLAVHGNVLLAHEWRADTAPEGMQNPAQNPAQNRSQDHSRINEAHITLDAGAWQFTAGKKLLGWDVGYGFRPNDVVQQEERRTQIGQTPEGRPLAMAEHFDAETAWTLVWVQPQRWRDETAADGGLPAAQRGAEEPALAARVYQRVGAVDLFGFARHGRHTGASVGAALAWVAGDALELHASARTLEAHDGLRLTAATDTLASANPWRAQTLGHANQLLIGAQWTGGPQLNVMLEAWYDGTAPTDAQWRDWQQRNHALLGLATQTAWRQAAAGNLAWQATPLDRQSLRRDNLFLRLAWQPADWTLAIDTLFTPADRGRVSSASVQWKGERWRLDASLRVYGGPAAALFSQLPLQRSLVLAATRAF
jgi:hypothetical protein